LKRQLKEDEMPKERISVYVSRTLDYLASPEGQRAQRENRLAHGFSPRNNLVAAIQAANPMPWIVRYEILSQIMAGVEERTARVAA
jgi:hypothetical protein